MNGCASCSDWSARLHFIMELLLFFNRILLRHYNNHTPKKIVTMTIGKKKFVLFFIMMISSEPAKYLFSFFVAYCFVGPSSLVFVSWLSQSSLSTCFWLSKRKSHTWHNYRKQAEIITSLWFLLGFFFTLFTNISYVRIIQLVATSINMETSWKSPTYLEGFCA